MVYRRFWWAVRIARVIDEFLRDIMFTITILTALLTQNYWEKTTDLLKNSIIPFLTLFMNEFTHLLSYFHLILYSFVLKKRDKLTLINCSSYAHNHLQRKSQRRLPLKWVFTTPLILIRHVTLPPVSVMVFTIYHFFRS